MPAFLLAQAVDRSGNFMNQEAYGRSTSLGFGVWIDQNRRLPPYDTMQLYPPDTLFLPTFLYESVRPDPPSTARRRGKLPMVSYGTPCLAIAVRSRA